MTMGTTLTIRGREYVVSEEGGRRYLTGKRGAMWILVRYAAQPTKMFAATTRSNTALDGVSFAEVNGEISVVAS